MPLSKTIQLEFQLVGPEETHRFPLLVASQDYRTTTDLAGPDAEHAFLLSGFVREVDASDKIFISFESSLSHTDAVDGTGGTFTAEGSVIFKFGERMTLAKLGDQKFQVTATLAKPAKD